jgi:predicted enzyme related to lactoylglutathione lyase
MRKLMVAATTAAVVVAAALVFAQDAGKPAKRKPIDVGAGKVAWFDITSSSLEKSRDFYGKLFGWRFEKYAATNLALMIYAGDTSIGTLRVAEGKVSQWNGVVYIQVDDVVASCDKLKELGGTLAPGFPFDLSDKTGAIGLGTDPTGHPIGLYSQKLVAAGKGEKPGGK